MGNAVKQEKGLEFNYGKQQQNFSVHCNRGNASALRASKGVHKK